MTKRNKKRRRRRRGTPLSHRYTTTRRGRNSRLEAEINELRAILERSKERSLEASERDKLMALLERSELVDAELAAPEGTTERLRELVLTPLFEDLPPGPERPKEEKP